MLALLRKVLLHFETKDYKGTGHVYVVVFASTHDRVMHSVYSTITSVHAGVLTVEDVQRTIHE